MTKMVRSVFVLKGTTKKIPHLAMTAPDVGPSTTDHVAGGLI